MTQHSLTGVGGIPPALISRLRWLGIESLEELVSRYSRVRFAALRGVGPATLARLDAALAKARLAWPEVVPAGGMAASSPPQLGIDDCIRAWIARHEPEVHAAHEAHEPGSYGRWLKAALRALEKLPLDPLERDEETNRILRLLGRYEREQRYARSRHALRDGIAARG